MAAHPDNRWSDTAIQSPRIVDCDSNFRIDIGDLRQGGLSLPADLNDDCLKRISCKWKKMRAFMDQRATDRRRLGCLIFLLAALCFYGLLWLYSSSDSEVVSAIEAIGGDVERGFSGTVVSFNNNKSVTDDDLKHLKGLLNVTGVELGNTRITDAGLVHRVGLKKLRTLNLGDTAITDAGLEHLKKIPSLRNLYLTDTEVSNDGLKDLQNALPKCQLTPFPEF